MSAVAADTPGLLAAAAEWRLLALLLSRPREGWHAEIAAVAGDVADAGLRAAARAAAGATEGAYHSCLGAGGPASPREAAHGGFADPGRVLAEITAYYEAFAFAPRAEEPGDHLAVECDFVSYLFLKEAFALAGRAGDAAQITREARDAFLTGHVACTAHALAARLPFDAPGHLAAAAAALARRVPAPDTPRPAHSCEDPLDDGCPAAGACGPMDRGPDGSDRIFMAPD